jgi:hypothetical protein
LKGLLVVLGRLAFQDHPANPEPVWDQPYLETCCRAALHRLHLCGSAGRPAGLMDDPCQRRLAGMGLCHLRADGRFVLTEAGRERHGAEVLKLKLDESLRTAAR